MNAPIFKVKTDSASSIKQYFKWASGVHNTFTLTDCSVAQINGVYEFLTDTKDQYNNLREYYQNQGNSDMYIVIYYSEIGDVNIYFCEYTGDITTVNPWDCDLLIYYTSMNLFDEVYWQEPQITIDTMPTVVTTNAGTGFFSYKLDEDSWSADAEISEYIVENLVDSSNHSFYVREKLADETYSETAECAFTVAFSSGNIQLKPQFTAIETDLSSVDIEFTFPSYDSKLLSGLTRDTLDISGLFINCGMKNGASCYNKGDYYLWYSVKFTRWLVTMQDYFNDDTNMYDYYESYLYANNQTAPETWADGTWYVGMMGDMTLSGTPVWNSGVFNVIPLGMGICRYQVDDGDYVELEQDVAIFTLAVSLDNNYSVKISELLDNGLWSPEVEIIIDCHLLVAPDIAAAGSITESDGGRNVAFEWNGAAESTEANILGGTGIFRYHVNSGPWSDETTDHRALQMFQLPTGDHTIYLEEKSSNGVWSETGTLAFTVINGAEAGTGDGGISVPAGKYLVVLNPVTGNEFLWNGVADISNLEPLTE
jgi:hypothetical protein